MQNLQDDKYLDDLSRQAADQFEPEQGLHSWEKMQPQLEAALPQKKERKRRFLIIFLLFLLIGGGVVFSTVWKNNQPAQQELVEGTAAKNAPGKPAEIKTATPATTTTDNQKASAENKEPNTTGTTTPGVTSNSTLNEPRLINKSVNNGSLNNTSAKNNNRRGLQKNNETAITSNRTSTEKQNKNVTLTDKNVTAVNKEDVVKSDADKTNKDVNAPVNDQQQKSNPEKTETAAPEKTIDEKAIAEKSTPEKATAKKDKAKKPSALKNRWEFGLVYAPDISTVKFTHTQKPGTNVGLTINYNLSTRFALQAGALYTSKNYRSYGKDYHPPKGYWTDYVKLETVTAECNMWDIPLNLRYNLAPRKASNVFAAAGLSSYLMQKEDYDFFYYYNGAPVSRYRSYNTEKKHWLSVLNLSVGYERQVSRNFSIQAEPFFKQPLKGLGFGNVKLNSTGIYFSVKYKPLR